jgi:hypothetical protein
MYDLVSMPCAIMLFRSLVQLLSVTVFCSWMFFISLMFAWRLSWVLSFRCGFDCKASEKLLMVVVAIFRRLSQFADSSNYCSCLYTLISYILLLRTIKYQMRMMRLLNSQFDCKLLICLFCLVSLPSIISTLFAKSIYLYIYIYIYIYIHFFLFEVFSFCSYPI